jgi:hypothetical protein
MAIIKKKERKKASKDIEKGELLYTIGGNVK